MPKYLKSDQTSHQMNSREMMLALGFKHSQPIPKDYEAIRRVKGVTIKVYKPLKEGRRKHRIFAMCPDCGVEVSFGRLQQHVGTKSCEKIRDRNTV